MNFAYTLQINLSPGDTNYAHLTVPRLLAAHTDAAEKLLVVDVCKPPRTNLVDPEIRFPEPRYSERVATIVELAENWHREGLVDRVKILRPGDELFTKLNHKYLSGDVFQTHDYGGCALMAYWAAFELTTTDWLVHYDADMLLHQEEGYSWAAEAIPQILSNESVIAAIPRPAAPDKVSPDAPSREEAIPFETVTGGWLNFWFSTRCFLFSLKRLREQLPILRGRIRWENRFARWFNRGYPRSPEIMLFRRFSQVGKFRFVSSDRRAWLLHPVEKGPEFLELLPAMLEQVAAGKCPPLQEGRQDVQVAAWKQFVSGENPRP